MKEVKELLQKAIKLLNEAECDCESCDCEEVKEESGVELSTLAAGERFTTEIGNFIVLDHAEQGTLVVTEALYCEDVKFSDDSTNYKESNVKKLCEGQILEDFIKEFGADNIVLNEVDLMTLDGQDLYGKHMCYVRPLTFDEVRKYNALLVNEDLPDWWWTCTSWSSEDRGWKYSIAVVSPSGGIGSISYCLSDGGVRPFCILKSNIFVSKKGE